MKTAFRSQPCLIAGITLVVALFLLPGSVGAQAPDAEGLWDGPHADQTLSPDKCPFWRRYRVGWAVGGSADGYGVILRTEDGGVTWTRQGQAGEIPDFSPIGVSAVDALNAWVVGGQVILRTRNGGLTWEQQELPAGLPKNFALFQVKALNRHTAFAVGSQSVLLRTRRGACPKRGSPWVKMRTASNFPLIQFSDVDAVDANHVWAVGGVESGGNPRNGLAIAFYNGVRWTPQLITQSTESCSALIGVSAVNNRTVWVVGGTNCPPYKTTDGGKSWRPISEILCPGTYDTNRVVGVTRNLIWVTTDNGVFRTADGGETWDKTLTCTGFCYAISAAGYTRAWASSLSIPPGDIYRWVDEQWESQLIPANSHITSISFVGARR